MHDDLGPTSTTIGTTLLITSLGSLFTLSTFGPIVTKIGVRVSSRISMLIWAPDIIYVGAGVPNVSIPLVTLDLVLLTAGSDLRGATMNTGASFVQTAMRRTTIPITQAMYVVGVLDGALLGTLAFQMGMPLDAHLFSLTVLELLAYGTAVDFYLTKEEVVTLMPAQDESDGGGTASSKARDLTRVIWREKQTVPITLIVMSASLMKDAANDWLNLSMVDDYGYSTTTASTVFTFLLLMMTVVRFASPRLEACLGSLMLLRITFSSAAVGLLFVAFAPHHLFVAAGIALWGIGSVLGLPPDTSALPVDSMTTPTRIPVSSTVNCGAALTDPLPLGLITDHIDYRRALTFVALPVLLAIVPTRQVPDRRGTERMDLASGD